MTPDEELAELRRAAEADLLGVGFDILLDGGPGHGRTFHQKTLPLLWLFPVVPSLLESIAEFHNFDFEPRPSKAAHYVPANMVTDDGLHIYRFTGIE